MARSIPAFGAWVRVLALAATCVSFAAGQGAPAQEGKRLALIIGNDAYTIKPLQNAVSDARAMDKALRAAGFRTILRENATKADMEKAVVELLTPLGPDDTALFFYAGHAVQIANENVLIPVEFAGSRSAIDARFQSFSLARMFDELKQLRLKRTIIVIDACRSNPVAEGHSLQAGLSIPANAGKESYTVFSTSPNQVAGDNPNGKNSYFTEALAGLIGEPGLPIDEVLNRVKAKVQNATQGAQLPWVQNSLTSTFYFHPPKDLATVVDVGLSEKWLSEALRDEQRGDWPESLDLLERVMKQEKSGQLHDRAKGRLPYIKARLEAEKLFDAGQHLAAAGKFREALDLDPFISRAGIEAVNGYLLTEKLEDATAVLQQVRQRGSSADVARADAMLKEIAVVSPAAAAALKQAAPAPPPLTELFVATRFGLPDFTNGRRYGRQAQVVELAKLASLFPKPVIAAPASAVPAPGSLPAATPGTPAVETAGSTPQASAPAEPPPTVLAESLHVEVHAVAGSRDLVAEEFGEIQIGGEQANTGVMVDGKAVSMKLPFKTKLPPGKYRIRTLEAGKTLDDHEVEVKSGATVFISVK